MDGRQEHCQAVLSLVPCVSCAEAQHDNGSKSYRYKSYALSTVQQIIGKKHSTKRKEGLAKDSLT